MSRLANWLSTKTFKREIAVAAILFWGVLTALMFLGMEPERIEALETPHATVTWTTWFYSTAAFGMQWVSKQFGAKL